MVLWYRWIGPEGLSTRMRGRSKMGAFDLYLHHPTPRAAGTPTSRPIFFAALRCERRWVMEDSKSCFGRSLFTSTFLCGLPAADLRPTPPGGWHPHQPPNFFAAPRCGRRWVMEDSKSCFGRSLSTSTFLCGLPAADLRPTPLGSCRGRPLCLPILCLRDSCHRNGRTRGVRHPRREWAPAPPPAARSWCASRGDICWPRLQDGVQNGKVRKLNSITKS